MPMPGIVRVRRRVRQVCWDSSVAALPGGYQGALVAAIDREADRGMYAETKLRMRNG